MNGATVLSVPTNSKGVTIMAEFKKKTLSGKYLRELLTQHKGKQGAFVLIRDTLIKGGYLAPVDWEKTPGNTFVTNGQPDRALGIEIRRERGNAIREVYQGIRKQGAPDTEAKALAESAIDAKGTFNVDGMPTRGERARGNVLEELGIEIPVWKPTAPTGATGKAAK